MPGFSDITGDESIMFADNASFDGTKRGGKITTNGQLWIGSTASPHVKVGTLTSTGGTIAITPGSGTINLETAGGAALQTLSDDIGNIVTPSANNIQLVGHVFEQGGSRFSTVTQGTHLLNINPMSTARWIVDPLGFNGTHTTIASAITSASSGDDIFIMSGTYTENLTLKAGVNLVTFDHKSLFIGGTPTVKIIGKLSYSSAGKTSLANIFLQTNSDFIASVTGSAASIVSFNNCYFNCTNNTGISFTTANTAAIVDLTNCSGDLGTTGIAIFANSSTGSLNFTSSSFTNSGSSTTASTSSAGVINMGGANFNSPVSLSGTALGSIGASSIICGAINTTALTINVAGAITCTRSQFTAGTATAIVITAGTLAASLMSVTSSNAATISGAGTIKYDYITFVENTTQHITVSNIILQPNTAPILIGTKSASNSTSITFTTGFNPTYSIFKLVFNNYTPATASQNLILRFSSDGGATYIATGYNSIVNWSNSVGAGTNTSTTGIFLCGNTIANSAALGSGTIYMHQMTNASQPSVSGTIGFYDIQPSAATGTCFARGPAATTVNAIQLISASGNITSGNFILFGIPA